MIRSQSYQPFLAVTRCIDGTNASGAENIGHKSNCARVIINNEDPEPCEVFDTLKGFVLGRSRVHGNDLA